MPIEPGTCPECGKTKMLMPRTGICRPCYSKNYYQKNKGKFQEYYKKLTEEPQSDDVKQPAE